MILIVSLWLRNRAGYLRKLLFSLQLRTYSCFEDTDGEDWNSCVFFYKCLRRSRCCGAWFRHWRKSSRTDHGTSLHPWGQVVFYGLIWTSAHLLVVNNAGFSNYLPSGRTILHLNTMVTVAAAVPISSSDVLCTSQNVRHIDGKHFTGAVISPIK